MAQAAQALLKRSAIRLRPTRRGGRRLLEDGRGKLGGSASSTRGADPSHRRPTSSSSISLRLVGEPPLQDWSRAEALREVLRVPRLRRLTPEQRRQVLEAMRATIEDAKRS